jgi:RNA polymerase sigma-32 factor
MDQRLDGWDVSLDAPVKEDSDTGADRVHEHRCRIHVEDQVAKKEMEVLLHKKIAEFRKQMTTGNWKFSISAFFRHPGHTAGDR